MTLTGEEHATAIVPGVTATLSDSSVKTAPIIITNQTSKTKYRDAAKKWTTMLRIMATSGPKSMALPRSAGLILYLACDDEAKKSIKQAETEEKIVLEGPLYEEDRTASYSRS